MLFLTGAAATETFQNFNVPSWHWVVLIAWFVFLILFDMLVLHKQDHSATFKEAAVQSLVWIGLGVGLGILFWPLYGADAAGQYFSGYLIEKSLSIDNVFAWSVILGYFKIPKAFQYRALFWGIVGALIMRTIFIFAGIAAIEQFEGILIIFGIILLFSGAKILTQGDDDEFDPAKSRLLGWFNRMIPISTHRESHSLFVFENGRRMATVLFMALLAIGITDAVFAVDSVPAILAVSRDPFIVVASNAAAILGLRALYFVFDKIKDRFWLLNKALGLLLIGVGTKMVISPSELFGRDWFGIHIPTNISLATIAVFMIITITASLYIKPPKHKQ